MPLPTLLQIHSLFFQHSCTHMCRRIHICSWMCPAQSVLCYLHACFRINCLDWENQLLAFPWGGPTPPSQLSSVAYIVCLELRKYHEASFCCCLFLFGFWGSLLLLLLLLLFWDRVSHWTRSSLNSLSLSNSKRSTCLHLASIGITNVILWIPMCAILCSTF